ncbi:MAG: iron-containing alcohol dehydrogenase [Christensenellales bacterium]|jgi:alcohol dehydrogenase class IV
MARFTIPRDIFFGKGSMSELKKLKGYKRAFVVTGGVIPKIGLLDKLINILKEAGMETDAFVDVEPDPSVETVMRGKERMLEFGPDIIVAIGGGSAIDAAKAMYVFYEHPHLTFEDIKEPNSVPRLRNKAIFVAIPSTSGTASEVTSFAVITDTHNKVKYPIADSDLTPDIAILDSEITATMPPVLVAHTGLDALTHAVEAYVAKCRSSFTNPLAIHSIAMMYGYLKESYDGDINARGEMHIAQCIAGMAFTNAQLGITHSLAHKVGGPFNLPHGLCNAILLPYVIQYNQKDDAALRHYANIARRLGLPGLTEKILANSLIEGIRNLIKLLNVPATFEEAGVREFMFNMEKRAIAEEAYLDPCTQFNPRETSVDDLEKILECAYYGRPVTF